jgi:branched-chain amino acid transport system permease protein
MAVRRPSGIIDENYGQSMAIIRTNWQWVLAAIALLIILTLPFIASYEILSLACIIGIAAVAALGLNILTGYAGLISLGHGAFMAVGAYTCAVLTIQLGLSFWIAMPLAALMSALVGGLFGLPALRLKGFYLAVSTLSAQVIIMWILGHVWVKVLGGYDGLVVPPPQIGDFVFRTPESMYYLIAVFVIILTFCAKNIVRTRVGRAFIAIRDNDIAAEAMGVNLFSYKMLAFLIASVYAGIAGSLWAVYFRAINPDHFSLMTSIWFLGMIIVGGIGTTVGPIFGATLIKFLDFVVQRIVPSIADLLPELATRIWSGTGPIIFGLVIVFFLIFEPRGIAHMWSNFKAWYRLWPFSY